MANATIFPQLERFQWSRPSAPNPRLAAPVSAVATTLVFTSPPLDETNAVITGNFLMGIKNAEGYTETVYVPAAAMSVDGLTATGVVRGIRLTGLDYTTGDSALASAHGQDSAIYCNITAIDFLMMQAALQGDIASGGTEWRIGDETDETITIYAQNADVSKPAWRYNKTTNIWEYSNDGVAFQPFGTGSGLTASTGAQIVSGDIRVNLADTTTFKDARTGNEARGVVTKAVDGKIDPSFLSFTGANNIDATANATISSGDAVAFDGISRLVKADGNDLNPFGLYAGVATSAGTAGNAMTFAGSGVVTVPAFTMADRQNCRLYAGVSNATSNTTTDTIGAITQWRAQIFVPQTGQDNVGTVTLNMTNSSCTGTGSVQIYAVTGTAPNQIPTGAALGTSANVTSWSSGDIEFTFATPVAVTPGTAYAIVFRLTVLGTGTIAWNYNNTSVYADGNSATSSNSGTAWTAEATFDRRFTVNYRGLAGEPVYLSDTAGGLSLAPGTFIQKIGSVLSNTQVKLDSAGKILTGTLVTTMTQTSSNTVVTDISVGFRPSLVVFECAIASTPLYEFGFASATTAGEHVGLTITDFTRYFTLATARHGYDSGQEPFVYADTNTGCVLADYDGTPRSWNSSSFSGTDSTLLYTAAMLNNNTIRLTRTYTLGSRSSLPTTTRNILINFTMYA